MTAQIIFFVETIIDADRLHAYQMAARPTLEDAGGRVTVAYGKQEVVEGAPLAGVVVIEFPTYEAAYGWYHSPAYTEAAKIRKTGGAVCHAVIVQGRPA
jgi:uncharacterized protein (DUF1330 family)